MSTKLDCENIARLAVILARYAIKRSDGGVVSDAMELAKIGRQLRSLAESECNYGLTPRQETRRSNLRNKALNLMCLYKDVRLETAGDPRGYCLRLRFPGGESNNLGGDFGV